MRKVLLAGLALVWSVLPAAAQVEFTAETPFDHHAHGMVGTMATGWLTVVSTDNHVVQLLIPANFHMPKDVKVGEAVSAAYKTNAEHENILVRIKPEDGRHSKTTNYVNSVPHL